MAARGRRAESGPVDLVEPVPVDEGSIAWERAGLGRRIWASEGLGGLRAMALARSLRRFHTSMFANGCRPALDSRRKVVSRHSGRTRAPASSQLMSSDIYAPTTYVTASSRCSSDSWPKRLRTSFRMTAISIAILGLHLAPISGLASTDPDIGTTVNAHARLAGAAAAAMAVLVFMTALSIYKSKGLPPWTR
jgi:hypothetical protein